MIKHVNCILTLIATAIMLTLHHTKSQTIAQVLNMPSNIPSSISVPAGNQLHLAVLGAGQQHYTFNGSDWVLQNATAALLLSVSANDTSNLFNSSTIFSLPLGNEMVMDAVVLVGRHFFMAEKDVAGGQPSWETPYSPIIISPLASALNFSNKDTVDQLTQLAFSNTDNGDSSLVTAKTVRMDSVKSTSITWNLLQRTSGSGSNLLLGNVSFVQRLATNGGLPPTIGVDAVPAVNQTVAVPYSATYAFYTPSSP